MTNKQKQIILQAFINEFERRGFQVTSVNGVPYKKTK